MRVVQSWIKGELYLEILLNLFTSKKKIREKNMKGMENSLLMLSYFYVINTLHF